MDIGAYIKASEGNASRRSAGYKKQSKFEGSLRQIRGSVLKLLASGPKDVQELGLENEDRAGKVLEALAKEQLIHKRKNTYVLGAE